MGWVVDPTVNALTATLFKIFYSPPDKLREMGLRARQYIAERYDWNVIGLKMIRIYRSLLV